MLNFLKRITNLKSTVLVDRGQFERVLKISQTLRGSLYQLDRQSGWTSMIEEIRKLYACELVSLFLVDEDDPDYLVLKAQTPSASTPEKVKLRIASDHGQGITSRAAKEAKTLILNHKEVKSHLQSKTGKHAYLPSGVFYSALFAPFNDRKGKLLGMIRLHNKDIFESAKRHSFTESDKLTIEVLAIEIGALLEHATAFDAIRVLIGDIRSASSTDNAVQHILSCAVRLLHGDHATLGLWSQAKNGLVFAGTKSVRADRESKKGEAIAANNIMVALWQSTIDRWRIASIKTAGEGDVWLNFGPLYAPNLDRCDTNARSSISIVLRAHQQPVGVLHLEHSAQNGFDDLDRQVLKGLAESVSVAIEAITMPWTLPEPDALEPDEVVLSLGETGGLFQSVVDHFPLVLWRKDTHGKFLWVNDLFCKHLGQRRVELLGKTDLDLFDNDLAQRYRAGDLKAERDGKFEDPEEPFKLPNGERSVIHVFKVRFLNHLGNVAGTQGVFLDVSGDKYRQLFREAPIGYYELNEKGGISHANKAGREMLGYPDDEILSRLFSELTGDPAVTEEIVAKHLTGDERDGEWRQPINLSKRDGTTIPVSIASCRVIDSAGNPTGLLCAIREISAGAEIEEALRDSDSRYLAKIRELSLPVFRLDRELKITFVNDAWLEEGGFKEGDVIGKTSWQLFKDADPELAKKYDEDNQKVLITEKVLDKIEFHHQKDGSKPIVRVLKFPVRDFDNNVIGVQGVFWKFEAQDSAKKALTDALENSKQEYRDIVLRAGEGIFQSTVIGQFIAANPAMVRLLGYDTEEELLSSTNTGRERFAISEHRKDYFERMQGAKPSVAQVIDYKIRKQNGETIWVSETVQKVVDHQKRERLVGFVMDITERHRAAEAKEDMLRMLAHQLRSPAWQCYKRSDDLVHQMDPQGLLLSGDNPSLEVRGAATIRGLARKTRGVAWSINMMSTLAHSDQIELSPKALAPIPPRKLIKMAREAARDAQLIRRVSASFKERMGIQTAVPQFEVDVDDKLQSNMRIIGDSGLIEQSLGCVIENAFKYSKPDSTIKIHCSMERESVTLSVENRPVIGLEINRDTRANCRTKDWRSETAKACDADGTGLGLWLVDRIMIAHKGYLHVYETDADGWNKFSLQFPLKPSTEIRKLI